MKAKLFSLVALVALLLGATVVSTRAVIEPCVGTNPIRCHGSFPEDGARYLIEVPARWNGTLVLYSHGYSTSETDDATDAGDPVTGKWLLDHGYALAGTSYAHAGWALQEAFFDQVHVLDVFDQLIGRHPGRTIAWGHSLGGIITAGLIQRNPERFDGALPMCGVLSGGVATWNVALDGAFVFKTLLSPGTTYPKLVHYTAAEIPVNLVTANTIIDAAQQTPAGRARIALMAAVGNLPGWFTGDPVEPADSDHAAREFAQYRWQRFVDFPFLFGARVDLEARARGNPSWNTGVDYRAQLRKSTNNATVAALYKQAGLDLDADLDRLAMAPRIADDTGAVDYMVDHIVFDGELSGRPVLTLHTSADGLVQVEQEDAYAEVVETVPHQNRLLEQVYVHRAGHCQFTPGETVAALLALVQRIEGKKWRGTDPDSLNASARSLGGLLNPVPPAYFGYEPAEFPRMFDARDLEIGEHAGLVRIAG
jgi:pimeloyl-ACP methyl ester carboxylesterase